MNNVKQARTLLEQKKRDRIRHETRIAYTRASPGGN
jgi:hypothetical protein